MNPGDEVLVLPSEYQRSGQVGRVVANHGILDDYVWVQFTPERQELIDRHSLQLIKGSKNGTADGSA